METKNNRSVEWVTYHQDPTSQPMFVLRETSDKVDIQKPGTDTVIEGVSKKLLRPLDSNESYELNGLYGRQNTTRTTKLQDGSIKKLEPVNPRPAYIMSTISRGPVIITSVEGGAYEAEDMDGKLLPLPLSSSELRILPKAIGEELRRKKSSRIAEILSSQPISQSRWDWGKRGYPPPKVNVNGREVSKWPTVRQGEIHVHSEYGPCVILSTTHGFEGETWAKIRKIDFFDGQVIVDSEIISVHIQERRTNKNKESYLFVYFRCIDEEFRAQLSRTSEVAKLLKKNQQPKK